MTPNFNVELDDKLYQQLKELCKGDENAMHEYIIKALNEKIDPDNFNHSSAEKDSLESYLNKGQPGSRNYGVKGQGW